MPGRVDVDRAYCVPAREFRDTIFSTWRATVPRGSTGLANADIQHVVENALVAAEDDGKSPLPRARPGRQPARGRVGAQGRRWRGCDLRDADASNLRVNASRCGRRRWLTRSQSRTVGR